MSRGMTYKKRNLAEKMYFKALWPEVDFTLVSHCLSILWFLQTVFKSTVLLRIFLQGKILTSFTFKYI